MELLNLVLIALLALMLRKLGWCLLWLWRYYHHQPVPRPISFLPRRTGETFAGHVDQTGRGKEE